MNYDISTLIEQIDALPQHGPGWDRRAEIACMKALRDVFSHPEMPLVQSFISYTLVALRLQREQERVDQIEEEKRENELRPKML